MTCQHLHIVRTGDWESACTCCGRVFTDPPACEPFVVEETPLPEGIVDTVRRIGAGLDASESVCTTAARSVVHVGGRSCNVNLIAAALYLAFRAHHLDRLESEVIGRVPGSTRRLFSKYLTKLRRRGLDRDETSISNDVDASTIFRRILSTNDTLDRREVTRRVRRAEAAFTKLRTMYADTKTVPVLIRMAIQNSSNSSGAKHENDEHHDQTA